MRNSKTTKELCKKLLQMPDLHSKPELGREMLIWKLYENAYVRAYCDSYDTCIDIISNSILVGSLTHWHPNEDDIYIYLAYSVMVSFIWASPINIILTKTRNGIEAS